MPSDTNGLKTIKNVKEFHALNLLNSKIQRYFVNINLKLNLYLEYVIIRFCPNDKLFKVYLKKKLKKIQIYEFQTHHFVSFLSGLIFPHSQNTKFNKL